jgi:hypothetical protein
MADQVLVFISHTTGMMSNPKGTSFVDGAEQAINGIERAKALHMEYFPAADISPADYSVQQLSKANLFVAVIGFDFGSRVRGDPGRSYTQLEFDAATRLRLPRLVFLLRPEAAGLQGLSARAAMPAQLEFRTQLEESGATVAYFSSVDDLKYKVQAAVAQWVATQEKQVHTPPTFSPLTGPRPVQATAATRVAGPIGCLSAVLVLSAIGLAVWTAVAASFPPWAPQAECQGAFVDVVKTSPPGFGQKGAVVEVAVRNSTSGTITVPAGRDVIATGTSGQQYAAESPGGDASWFFPVDVQPGSSKRLGLSLSGSAGSDEVTLTVPDVHGTGLPFTACRMRSSPVNVRFEG